MMTDKREKEFVYAPFCRAAYDLHAGFSSEQKEALSTSHKRSRNYGRSGSLSSLITPLLDIANKSSTGDKLTRIVIMAMLAEMQNAGQPCWNWHKDRWISLFDKYRSGKPLMMAFHTISVLSRRRFRSHTTTPCRFTPVPFTAAPCSVTSCTVCRRH